jgi:hypothetical protein
MLRIERLDLDLALGPILQNVGVGKEAHCHVVTRDADKSFLRESSMESRAEGICAAVAQGELSRNDKEIFQCGP